MSQYNKLSNIQYARFHILPVDLHFENVLVCWYPHPVPVITRSLRLTNILMYHARRQLNG